MAQLDFLMIEAPAIIKMKPLAEGPTSKYKRQDSEQAKKNYPGWTDSGNAATLAVNIKLVGDTGKLP